MANRYPLIVNSTTNRIAELPAGDNLDLSNSNISNVANINLSGNLNSGITQIRITGGINGQYISTDGVGNLTFVTPSIAVAETVSNAAQPNITSTGTLISLSVTGNITAGNIIANGQALTSINGANVSGQVSFAAVANSVAGANVSGAVALATSATTATTATSATSATSATTAGTVTTAAQPNITSVGTLTSVSISGTATIGNIAMTKFNETLPASTNTSTSISPDMSTGSIFRFSANANFTFNGLTNAVAGSSATIIITQDATGSRTLTSTMKFAGASKTLSTAAGSIDIIGVFYDGTTYYASLTKGYA